MSDLREELVRAAGDVSGAPALAASAATLGRQRLRRRRRVTGGVAAAGLAALVVGIGIAGSGGSTDDLRVVPAESASVSPQREAATEELDAAVDEALPGWSSTLTTLAGYSIDQQSQRNGWFVVRQADAEAVQVRLTVQSTSGGVTTDCHDCTTTVEGDGSKLAVGSRTSFVSAADHGSTVVRPWAFLLTPDGRKISAEAEVVDTPEEPLPDGSSFPADSPVTEATMAALVQLPELRQLDLTG